jgi:TatD DNase family protein
MIAAVLPPLVDTHCHLSNVRFADDRAAVIARMREAGIGRAVCIATGLTDAVAVRAIAADHRDLLRWSVGLDPFSCHEAGTDFSVQLAQLDALLSELRGTPDAPCALGEIGLEYHHPLNPHDVQQAQLAAQLELAVAHDLPVVIHCRDAHPDMLRVLAAHPRARGVIHSFIGGPEEARAYRDLGWSLSFNGTLTYKGNDTLRAAARVVPADRLLIETDAPYLAPVPHRGKRNEPAYVVHTLALLADLRAERVEDVAAWTTHNAVRLFGLAALW